MATSEDCCELKPQQGDKPVEKESPVCNTMAQVMLLCDNNTGVFFYRYKGKLYMRIVECD